MSGIPCLEGIEVGGDEAEVTQFVNSCGTRIEALELTTARFGRFVIYDEFLGEGLSGRWRLAVDEGNREVFRIEKGYDGAATRSVREGFYAVCLETGFVSLDESVGWKKG